MPTTTIYLSYEFIIHYRSPMAFHSEVERRLSPCFLTFTQFCRFLKNFPLFIQVAHRTCHVRVYNILPGQIDAIEKFTISVPRPKYSRGKIDPEFFKLLRHSLLVNRSKFGRWRLACVRWHRSASNETSAISLAACPFTSLHMIRQLLRSLLLRCAFPPKYFVHSFSCDVWCQKQGIFVLLWRFQLFFL